jgi:hypothetical protein
MKAFAGRMRFEIPDNWRDNSSYEYRSPDGMLYIQAKREILESPINLDEIAKSRLDLFKEGLPGSTVSALTNVKASRVEGRQADVNFTDGDGDPVIMRLLFLQVAQTVLVSFWARTPKGKWSQITEAMNKVLHTFAMEGDPASLG